jgi:hypothetical protein
MQLVVDALMRGQRDEAMRFLREVQDITSRIEQHLVETQNAAREPDTPDAPFCQPLSSRAADSGNRDC